MTKLWNERIGICSDEAFDQPSDDAQVVDDAAIDAMAMWTSAIADASAISGIIDGITVNGETLTDPVVPSDHDANGSPDFAYWSIGLVFAANT